MSDKEVQLKRAKQALISHDYETAARIYKMLIREDCADIGLKIELGNLYVKSGQDELALACFEEINKKNPGNVDVLLALGGIYRRLAQYDDSIIALELAIDTGEKGIQVAYSLGFTYRQMGKYDSAIECFQSVVDQNPRDVLAFNHLGAIYALQNNHEKAVQTYQHGLKLDPNHPVLQLNIAKSLEAIGEYKRALSFYEGALRSKPGWTEAIEAYSDLLLKDNQVKTADSVVSRALKINPNDAKMHTAMGKVYNRKSIFDSAEQEFKKALSKDDKYSPALSGLAYSQEKQGKHSEAAKTIQKAQELSPNDISILKQTAHILLSANYLPAAYEKISHLWKLNKDDVETINLLGQYYICHGEEDKIEECFDKIERLKPEYTDVYKDWGNRFAQVGDEKNAEDYLKVAVHENPKDSDAMVQLATLYDKQGRESEALNILGKASKTDEHNHSIKKVVEKIENKKAVQQNLENENASDFTDMNADFEDETGDSEEISMGSDEEISPFELGLGSGNPTKNKNAGKESPIDFDAQAEDDNFLDYDSSRDMENLIDSENDSIDSMIQRDSDFIDDGFDTENESTLPEEENSTVEMPQKTAQPKATSPSKNDGDFDFNQFGSEDLSGDTDDIVSIDEIMESEVDENKPDNDLIDFDEPVDESDDSTFDANPISENRMTLPKEENIRNPNENRSFEHDEDLFKDEDVKGHPFDEHITLPEEKEEPRQYDEYHQPRKLSNEEYLSLERQIQRVANTVEDAAYKANQAMRAAKMANEYAQDADDKVSNAERRLNKSMGAKLEDMLEEKFKEKLDEQIEQKISEKIGDDLNSKISETIDNFVMTPDAELFKEEQIENFVPSDIEVDSDENSDIDTDVDSENEDIPVEAQNETEIMLKKAVEILPSIVTAIANKDVEEEFSTSLDMFKKLREMLEYLPPAKRKQFMTSKNRLMLDYIIARLSGKPGLFATICALLQTGVVKQFDATDEITSDLTMDTNDDEYILNLVSSVMENIKVLCTNLEDEYLRDALDSEILELLEKIKVNSN